MRRWEEREGGEWEERERETRGRRERGRWNKRKEIERTKTVITVDYTGGGFTGICSNDTQTWDYLKAFDEQPHNVTILNLHAKEK